MRPQRDWQAPTVVPVWTDEMWDEMWERTLSQVQRHRLAVAVLRLEIPPDVLGRRIVPELARRWRRSCVAYAVGYGLFATFWLVIGVAVVLEGGAVVTPWWMGGAGVIGVAIALGIRRRVRVIAGPPPRRR